MPARKLRLAAQLALLAALGLSTSGGAQDSAYPSAKQGGNYMHNFYFPPARSSTPWAPSFSPDGKWIAEHVFAQFDEAKRIYQGFLAQAPPAPTQEEN